MYGWMYVWMSHFGCLTITFERIKIGPSFLICCLVLTIYRSLSVVKVRGQISRSQGAKTSLFLPPFGCLAITIERIKIGTQFLVCYLILTIYRSLSKVKVKGQISRSQGAKTCSFHQHFTIFIMSHMNGIILHHDDII